MQTAAKDIDYPKQQGGRSRPHVIIVGAGVAGMSAAHRLLERGHDVTLLEANSFLGGKLGAHQGVVDFEGRWPDVAALDPRDARERLDPVLEEIERRFGYRKCAYCTEPCCKLNRLEDWHEHCYHMYLNWYHNFWNLMRDIGVINRFEPMTDITFLPKAPGASPIRVENPGSSSSILQNLTCGATSPANVLLHDQSLRDLLATADSDDRRLDQMSVEGFLRKHRYTTAESRKFSHRVLAKAFAAPTALASASSFKSFLKYGARLPEPTMWLLNGHTREAIFDPWLRKLVSLAGHVEIEWEFHASQTIYTKLAEEAKKRTEEESANRPSFTLKPLTRLAGIEVDWDMNEFLLRIEKLVGSPSVQPGKTAGTTWGEPEIWHFQGQVVLAIPPRQLARIVHTRADDRDVYYEHCLAGMDPSLVNVTRLTGAPIMTLDVVFREPLKRPLPRGIVLLVDSKYEMSIYDNTQVWKSEKGEKPRPPKLSICASDANPLTPFVEKSGGPQTIAWLLLKELQRYIDFDLETDILHCRTHLQTNAGAELFINAVDTWNHRPKTTTEIPDLFIAGDFVQTPIDVVTIEGATMSGLMAAEAVRRRTGLGRPVEIASPDVIPGAAVKLAAEAGRPFAYAAWAVAEAEDSLIRVYERFFPGS